MPIDDAYTKALLHFEGTEGSTTFIDESGIVWTAYGGANIVGGVKRFGRTCGWFDSGNIGYIYSESSSALTLGSSDFTIDVWIWKPATQPTTQPYIINNGAWAANKWSLHAHHSSATDNKVTFWSYEHNEGAAPALLSTTSINTMKWMHVAVIRIGDTLSLAINGNIEDSEVLSAGLSLDGGGSQALNVGGMAGGGWLSGFLDELRVSVGVGRWSGNFTPPTIPYASPANFLHARRDRFNMEGVSTQNMFS